jgi:hypothetical protein
MPFFLGFAHYYSTPRRVSRESSTKQKEREFLAWEKANFEEQSFQNKMSPMKSLLDFSNWECTAKQTEEEI